MVVYRYLSLKYGLKALQENRLRIGRIDAFDDLLEFWVHIEVEPEAAAVEEKVFEVYRLTRDDMVKKFGIICFCAEKDNDVLWGSYAGNHGGIAIGFDLPIGSESDINIDDTKIYKVSYTEDRPKAGLKDILEVINEDSAERLGRKLFHAALRKKPIWSSQNEYRRFCGFSAPPIDGHYFCPFSLNSVKEIVIGERCPETPTSILEAIERSGNRDFPKSIRFSKMRYERNVFRAISLESSLL